MVRNSRPRSPAHLILPHLRSLKHYEGVDPVEVLAQRAGIPPEQVIKLDGNENPYGPSPRVLETLARFRDYHRYPDPSQRRIRAALADHTGMESERIVATSGADELIDLLVRLLVAPGEAVLVVSPTFGMYAFNAQVSGGRVMEVERDEEFDIDVAAVKGALDSSVKLIFIASPNNPTGNAATEEQVRWLLELGPAVVVDETYHDFYGGTVLPLVREYPNLVVLRTLSKWAGLAGLRVGFGVMDPEVAQVMLAMKPPYNVNLAAEVALLASLEDREFLLGRVREIVRERERFFALLQQVPGLKPWPSQGNFILCQLPQGQGKATYEALARRGIVVRYFDTPRLRDCIRITVGLPHQDDAVVEALQALLKE
ncbi:MAG: histidinol-phosphate transaminase [Dehalococcoidia bacterium]